MDLVVLKIFDQGSIGLFALIVFNQGLLAQVLVKAGCKASKF